MRQWVRRAASAAVVSLSAGVAGLSLPVPALAVSPDIVISQVYGGGGNTGATYTHDFIELYNRGATEVDVTGWTVQYAGAAGDEWQTTALSGEILPGAYYLVQQARGFGGTTALPTPNAVGTIAMSLSSGKVALVTNQTPLECATNCAAAPGVRDFVGYGAASSAEGNPAPTLSNTTAALRVEAGRADTDDNSRDFVAGPPDPRNSPPAADEADLAVTKMDEPDPVTAGSNITYTIIVGNAGPGAARSVVLRDAIPAGTTFVSFTTPADGWTLDTPPVGGVGDVTATRASLDSRAGARFALVVKVDPTAAGDILNHVDVTSATTDPDLTNNAADTTTAVGPTTPGCTITGTAGTDIINGTLNDDVICGLGGNDIINGRGGNDVIHGGPGRDLLSGGKGDDMVYGEGGTDFIKIDDGVSGNDNADGGPGFDLCSSDPLDAVLSCP